MFSNIKSRFSWSFNEVEKTRYSVCGYLLISEGNVTATISGYGWAMVHLSAHACRPAASAREHNRHGRLGLSAGDRALHDAGQAFDQLMADDGAQRSRCDPIAPIRLRPFRNAALPQVKRRRARTCFQVNPPRYLGMGVEVPDQIDQVAVPLGADARDIGGPQPWIGSPESLLPCRFRRGCPEHVVFSAEEADAPSAAPGFSPAPRRRHGGCGDLGLGI